jgi:hypothetical protein
VLRNDCHAYRAKYAFCDWITSFTKFHRSQKASEACTPSTSISPNPMLELDREAHGLCPLPWLLKQHPSSAADDA